MYWYKPLLKRIGLAGIALFLCCTWACKPEIKETGAEVKYFDLKGYFKAEAARITKLNPSVFKSVEHNGAVEVKAVSIDNWERELNLFTESDINKPAWKSSYTVDSLPGGVIYKAKLPDLKTRIISIAITNGHVSSVYIVNDTKNFLYKTTEKLTYIPDQYYLILKSQQVKVMGANKYIVKGQFVNGGR